MSSSKCSKCNILSAVQPIVHQQAPPAPGGEVEEGNDHVISLLSDEDIDDELEGQGAVQPAAGCNLPGPNPDQVRDPQQPDEMRTHHTNACRAA